MLKSAIRFRFAFPRSTARSMMVGPFSGGADDGRLPIGHGLGGFATNFIHFRFVFEPQSTQTRAVRNFCGGTNGRRAAGRRAAQERRFSSYLEDLQCRAVHPAERSFSFSGTINNFRFRAARQKKRAWLVVAIVCCCCLLLSSPPHTIPTRQQPTRLRPAKHERASEQASKRASEQGSTRAIILRIAMRGTSRCSGT